MSSKTQHPLLIRMTELFCCILLLVILGGCIGDELPVKRSTTDGLIPIEASVDNIHGWQTGRNVSSRSLLPGDTVPINEKTGVLSGLAMINTPDTHSTPASTRAASMGTGVRFRMIAYRCATAATITTASYANYGDYQVTDGAGTTVATKVLALQEGTYTFVCYSYGDGNTLPAFNQNALTLSIGQGKDFMTCIKEGVQVATYGKSFLLNNIHFSRRCSRLAIRVAVDTQRMAAITACSATLQLPDSTATYTFTTDALAADATASNIAVTWTTPKGTSVLSNNVYVLPQTAKNLILTLNPTIGGKSITNVSATITGQTLLQQTAYECKVSLNTSHYIVGGAIWAQGNLRYAGGSYQFYPQTYTYSYNENGGDYWPWNSLTCSPTGTSATTWSDARDPCKKVSPANTWRTPTETEAAQLKSAGYSKTMVSGVLGYTFGGILFFSYSGHFAAETKVMSDKDTRGLYWTTSSGVGNGSFWGFTDGECNVNWPSNMANHGMCIRCVR